MLGALSIAALTISPPASAVVSEGFESFPAGQVWREGTRHGKWRAAFDGFGHIRIAVDGSNVLEERPARAARTGETHAALVTSVPKFGDLDLTVRSRTTEQLRASPNPWEVAWVLWRFVENRRFYYLILKPNGWELGKADPAYPGAQRFLATGSTPTFAVGPWHTARIRHVGSTVTVWGDGQQLTQFTDHERPYASGVLGLYTEDAEVHFDDIVADRL